MKIKKLLTIEEIDQKIGSKAVFDYYLGKVNYKSFCNPLRKDRTPSCNLGMDDRGVWRMWDFADSNYCGGYIDIIMYHWNLDIKEAIEKVYNDLGLLSTNKVFLPIIVNNKEVAEKKYSDIKFDPRPFNLLESNYWTEYGLDIESINSVERDFQILTFDKWWLNGKRGLRRTNELAFIYHFTGIDRYKVYFPTRSDFRWFSNVPLNHIIGLSNLHIDANTLICKSIKDYLTCRLIHPYTCAIQNESLAALSEENAKYIIDHSKEVYYGGDGDIPGKRASRLITSTYGIKHINPPDYYVKQGLKDWADINREDGIEPLYKHFRKKKLL